MTNGRRILTALLLGALSLTSAKADVPALGRKDLDVRTLGPEGAKPSIAVDSRNQPHIVVMKSEYTTPGRWYLYDKTTSGWTSHTFNLGSYYSPAGTFNNPHIEIDTTTDRAWMSGVMMIIGNFSGVGIGVVTRGNVDEAASNQNITFTRRTMVSPPGWPTGNLSVDSDGAAYGWINTGPWEKWGWNNGFKKTAGGTTLFPYNAGERPTGSFRVSRAAPQNHRNTGRHGVWHAAINGHPNLPGSLSMSQYCNSMMYEDPNRGEKPWINPYVYPHGTEEDNFPGLATDNINPEAAYIAIDGKHGHIYINVWNGQRMLYSVNSPLFVEGGIGYSPRWQPQLAPAQDGGAWICFDNNSRIKLKYLGPDGVNGATEDICPGKMGSIAVDTSGDIHVVYKHNGSMRYRRVETASLRQDAPDGKAAKPASGGPTFTWTDSNSTPADTYRVLIENAAGTVFLKTGIAGTASQWTYATALDYGSYTWKLRRVVGGVSEDWVGPMDFEIVPQKPTIVRPIEGRNWNKPQQVSFSWTASASPEVDKYSAWVRKDGNYLDGQSNGNTNWDATAAAAAGKDAGWIGGAYEFRVVAEIDGISMSRVAGPRTFNLVPPPTPLQVAPAPGAKLDNVSEFEFQWTRPGNDAAWDWNRTFYQVQVNHDKEVYAKEWFGGVNDVNHTNWVLRASSGSHPFGYYKWWIRSWTPYGMGTWSTAVEFINSRGMWPSGGEVVSNAYPVFNWDPSPNAPWYQLWINRDKGDSVETYIVKWVKGATRWDPGTMFKPGEYRWWVRGWSPAEGAEPWLTAASFVVPTNIPGEVTLIAPAGAVATPRPEFDWESVEHATWYHVLAGRTPVDFGDYSTAEVSKWVEDQTEYTPAADLPAGRYEWSVRPWGPHGMGPWSTLMEFSYGVAVIDYPTGTIHDPSPEFRWSAVSNATWYCVLVQDRDNGNAEVGKKWVEAPTTFYSFQNDFPLGNYKWWVRTLMNGKGTWSAGEEFTVELAP